jgi:hypothetical protein
MYGLEQALIVAKPYEYWPGAHFVNKTGINPETLASGLTYQGLSGRRNFGFLAVFAMLALLFAQNLC